MARVRRRLAVVDTIAGARGPLAELDGPQAAKSNPVKAPFYAVYMAIFELTQRRGMEPVDGSAIMSALKNVSKPLEPASHHITSESREGNIKIIIGLIQDLFVVADPPLLKHGPGLAKDFVNSIRRSGIESSRYEFKQGILDLGQTRQISKKMLDHLPEIICSMANIGPDSIGFIFIGVADKKKDAERIRALDEVPLRDVDGRYVVGIDREAKVLGIGLESHCRTVATAIQNSKLTDPVKSQVLMNIDPISYRGVTVLRITVPSQKTMSWVGEDTYLRIESETHPATPKQAAAIQARF